ncbi:MAG: plasmid pRiA4b ORF-3 family protein [Opitutae bacterium]|nr:plasmid pRiA4b ORF-3 family protein [Opitutae bacterium]
MFALMKKRSIPSGRTDSPVKPAAKKMVQLKITLRHSQPSIWRRVVVPGDIGLGTLHDVIQAVMGWDNSHPHLFTRNRTVYSYEDLETGCDGKPVLAEAEYLLCDLGLRTGAAFAYEYDFGDSWWHDLKVEKTEPMTERPTHAVCLAGANAAPPDDTGGVWGYSVKLACLADPKHPDHQYIREWFGDDFDPAVFKMDETNRLLCSLRV